MESGSGINVRIILLPSPKQTGLAYLLPVSGQIALYQANSSSWSVENKYIYSLDQPTEFDIFDA